MVSRDRRRFLRLIGVTLAVSACASTCAGAGLLMAGEDHPDAPLPVGFPDVSFGQDRPGQKILVAYASAAGSTGGVAEAIGKTLAVGYPEKKPAIFVDVRPVQSVTTLEGYRAVVVGSAIHGGKWLPEMVEFVLHHQDLLRQVPTAYFLVGLMVASSSPANRELVAQFLEAERALVQPVAEGRFVGALFPNKYPFPTGFGMRFFLAYCGLGLRGGDYRSLDSIQAWAKSVRPLLVQE